jgi:hypothetical protein
MWIFIDGHLEATVAGPSGDISYPDNDPPGEICGPSPTEECINLDPYLIIGASRHERGASFTGMLDDLRFSWWLRYFKDFDQTPGFHFQDTMSVSILRFNEGIGNILYDTAGNNGGTSNAVLHFGGSPSGPEWVISELFAINPIYIPSFIILQPPQ